MLGGAGIVPVYPHVSLLAASNLILIDAHDLYRSFIRMDHLTVIDQFVYAVIDHRKVGFGTLDHPVTKGVGLEVDAVALEGSGLSLDRECIYVLSIQDGCNKSRSSDTVPEQILGTGSFYDSPIIRLGCVHMHVVLVDDKGLRNE